jgi:hypothetical protein
MSNSIPFKQTTTANISIADSGAGYAISNGWSNHLSTAHTDIQSKLKVRGDAEFDGDIAFKGRSLDETLKKIEERLGILIPNVRLEEDWEELKDLRMQYLELERQLLEKQRVFDILKKQ